MLTTRRVPTCLPVVLLLLGLGCGEPESDHGSAAGPLHLEELLEAADVEGAEQPAELAEPLVWNFERGDAGWEALPTVVPGGEPARVTQTEGGLLVRLDEGALSPEPAEDSSLHGGSSSRCRSGTWAAGRTC